MQIGENEINLAINAALSAGKEILRIYESDDFDVSKKADDSPLTLADKNAHSIIASSLEQTEYPILSEEGKSIAYSVRKDWTCFWLVDPLDGTKEFIKRNGEFTVNIAFVENETPVFGVVYAPVLDVLYVGIEGEGSGRIETRDQRLEARGKRLEASDQGLEARGVITIEDVRKFGATLPCFEEEGRAYRVVASRSHVNAETEEYLEKLKTEKGEIDLVSKGSSLKLCMIATGEADEYPRLGPTMEWDTAAAHAVVKGMGKKVRVFGSDSELRYNKEDLLNPYFLVR